MTPVCYGCGVKNPDLKREFAWLLGEKYQGVESTEFNADVARLEAGEPLAYVIGQVPFLDCAIYLDSRPLIPRPETEYWVEEVISAIHTQQTNLRDSIPKILDLCAGSGAIGVALAKAVPEAHIAFSEIDPAHLATIEKNLAANTTIHSSEKYQLVCGDLFRGIEKDRVFDFILTNPPYVDKAADTVDTAVTLHEPHLALFGGLAGMEIITKIILEAPQYLNQGGQLWIEHEPFQSEAILTLSQEAGYATAITHADQYSVSRFSVLTMAQ